MRLLLALLLALWATTSVAQSRLPPASQQYRIILTNEARSVWGLNANIALFAAQTHQESGWRPDAVSHVGAAGLTQFMPATAEDMNKKYASLRTMPTYSPHWSLRAQALYNKELFDEITPFVVGGQIHPCDRYAMMLSAYNGGRGWLKRDRRLAQERGAFPDRWWNDVEHHSRRSAAAFKENRDYPRIIMQRRLPLYLNHGWPGENPCL